MTVLKKIYKGNKLEFRPDNITPGFYIGYKENGQKFEEMCEGWGWTLAAFFADQLDELEDWSETEELPETKVNQQYTWTAVYQIGGTANFSWRKCLPQATYQAGADLRDELIRMGYPAHLYRTDLLEVFGTPTEYHHLAK